MQLENYLPYLLPPLLGALIGYVTNYIAIRMLFRPLRPWRILGLRLPLTPGIIPAKRGELAEKMGEMVGRHLLTGDDVGRALEKESFRRELRQAVADKLGEFLDRNLGPPETLVPQEFRSRFRELVDLLRWKAVKGVFDYLESDVFAERLHAYLRRSGDEILARDLAGSLAPEHYAALRSHLDERVEAFLQSPVVARDVERLVDDKLEQWLSSERSLRSLLPPDLVELLLVQLGKELPVLLEKLGGLMYDPDFRDRLVKRAKLGLEKFLDSLEGMTGLLAGFLDLRAIHGKIPGFLDQAGDEIARWLKDEQTQKKVASLLRERLDLFLDRPLATYVEKISYEKVAGVRRYSREKAVALIQGPRTRDAALALVDQGFEQIQDRPFGNLLNGLLPPGELDRLRDELAQRILQAVRSPAARRAFEGILAEKLDEWLFRKPLGRLSARLPADLREELEAGLCRQLAELLKKEVPPLVETLNVARMVEEKVNGLDILQVEGLLMGIMKEQFKYINLFGALLGLLIGLANLLVLGLI